MDRGEHGDRTSGERGAFISYSPIQVGQTVL